MFFHIHAENARMSLEIAAVLRSVGVEDTEECFKWAFGRAWDTFLVREGNVKWNEMHSDLFVIYNTDNVIVSLERIGRAYLERKV